MRAWLMAVTCFASLLVSGCSSMNIETYRQQTPALSIESYFLGKTWAWGMFEDRFGKVRRSFTVEITGQWEQDQLVLDEHFVYNDGEKDQRIWRITPLGNGQYEGVADDILGKAVGQTAGNALNWQYDMLLPVGERTWRVHFNDWMFLQPNQVLINKANVTKWGIHLGTVTLFFSKQAPEHD